MRRSGLAATLLAALLSLALAGQVLGVTWSPAIKLEDDPAAYLMNDRALVTASGATHLVYADGGVVYRRSTSLGGAWSDEAMLAPDTATVQAGTYAVAAYGSIVAVVYRSRNTITDNNGLYLRRSLDKGLHWLPRQTLASYVSDRRMGTPSIAIGSSGIHVVWTDRRDGSIYYRRSIDDGATFTTRKKLAITTHEIVPQLRDGWPSVAVSGDRVYVAWSPANASDAGCDTASASLAMRRSTDGGVSFKSIQTVDGRAQWEMPALAASGSTLLATYTLCDGHVVVARSTDGGLGFTRKSITSAPYFHGDVALSGSRAILAYSSGSPDSDRLVARTSGDGGATWSPGSTVATGIGFSPPSVVSTSTGILVAYAKIDEETGETIAIFTRKGVP